ncbi:MAG: 4Fe-4S dicluster domain-containing protein [Candidatus Zixiibacteriota bacterium]
MKKLGTDMPRREFLENCSRALPPWLLVFSVVGSAESLVADEEGQYDASKHNYAMGVDIHRCIGCGRCADACKKENKVPLEPTFFRTWVERYIIPTSGEARVDSPNGGIDGFPEPQEDIDVLRTFFVPKLCNHCANPPCVQVCPVGATFESRDGVVLVDDSYCVGCRYCIQACPYGARYLHPEKKVADKCTFCYHRITKGLAPACVEVCPTQARIFGESGQQSSPLRHFLRFNDVSVLKPWLNTSPKVYYANADGEVR